MIGMPMSPESTSSGARPPIRINSNANTVITAATIILKARDGSALLMFLVPVYDAMVYVVASNVVVKKMVAIIINSTSTIDDNGNELKIAGIAAIASS